MDWPVASSNAFIAVALVALIAAPIIGAIGGWRALPVAVSAGCALTAAASLLTLSLSWRAVPGGMVAALEGHLALFVSVAALTGAGRLTRSVISDRLNAALAGLVLSVIVVTGIFAAGPVADRLSSGQSGWLLFANPLVTVTSAAGIDFLHLDTIYRTSPLAHRGVALPVWTAACGAYAVAGLAALGASRLRPWSH